MGRRVHQVRTKMTLAFAFAWPHSRLGSKPGGVNAPERPSQLYEDRNTTGSELWCRAAASRVAENGMLATTQHCLAGRWETSDLAMAPSRTRRPKATTGE